MQLREILRSTVPPPRFLRMPAVGVDISDTSLKYIEFVPNGHAGSVHSIRHFGDIDVPEGTLTRGEIKSPDRLVEALIAMRAKTNAEYVRVSLPEERAYIFETRVKRKMPLSEIRGVLEFRLEENVPLSPRDAYFDYEIYELPDASDELGISVTAYACDTINGYYDACAKAGVIPLSFEVEAKAIVRAILPPDAHGTCMVVDCGKTRTGVGIVMNGVLMYTSTIDIGGKDLSAAMRKSMGAETKEADLSKIKNTEGLRTDSSVREILVPVIDSIKDELLRRIEYWNGRDVGNDDRFIERILLCGGSANLNGLPEYLSTALNITTERADVWRNALDTSRTVPPIDQAHAYGYATAVGLGLSNLL